MVLGKLPVPGRLTFWNIVGQGPIALAACAVGPCPTIIQIVGRPGTGSLPSTIAPPDHPRDQRRHEERQLQLFGQD